MAGGVMEGYPVEKGVREEAGLPWRSPSIHPFATTRAATIGWISWSMILVYSDLEKLL